MYKLITKQFMKNWKIWLSVLPIFFVSGVVFSASFTILTAINNAGNKGSLDYSVFMQMPIVVGTVVLFLLTTNTMKQCIDFFDDTSDILLLLGASPIQLSFLMAGQMLLIGSIGTIFGSLFSLLAAQLFIRTLPLDSAKQSLSQLPLHFSWNIVFVTMIIQLMLITITCMRYCLKNYKQRKGTLSSYSRLLKAKNGDKLVGIIALTISVGTTLFLYFKEIPDPTIVKEYVSSMSSSMNLLLLLWLSVLVSMSFLIRPIFKIILNWIVNVPSMAKYPRLRSAFYNIDYNVEELIKLIRPVSVIVLLVGNFISLFLNTKLLIDGANNRSYISDLILSLVFIFGAPIVISLANVVASIFLFKIKTSKETKDYFFSGCTPSWLFKLRLIEISTVSVISIIITLFGTFLYAVPLLRVAYLGGGDIFKANWMVNILLSFGAFFVFFMCFILVYWTELYSEKKYIE